MTVLNSSVRFGVDWRSVTPDGAAKVPLTVADAVGELHIVRDGDGNTPLHLAAAHTNDRNVIVELVEAGADIYEKNTAGQLPATVACEHENFEAIIGFVDAGCDAFWIAGNAQSSDMLGSMVSAIKDEDEVNSYDDEINTPLQCAVLANNAAAVEGLMLLGVKVSLPFREGENILHFAASHDTSREVIKILVGSLGVNCLDAGGCTPLDYAVECEVADAADELRESGGYTCNETAGICFGINWKTATASDVEKLSHEECGGEFWGAPIHWASRFCLNSEVIDALVATGADVNNPHKRVGNMPRRDWGFSHSGGVEELYGYKAPIHWAARDNFNPAVIQALIKAGADVNTQDKNNLWMPLHYAADAGNHRAVACLIEAGAYVDADFPGVTPLSLAEKRACPKTIAAFNNAQGRRLGGVGRGY